MTEYAIEADPGQRTASFPTFDNLEAALAAASVPAMVREGLPRPRVLTRRGGQWYVVCAAPTWHGPCILLRDHDPGSAYHRGGGQDQFERSEYEGNWTQAAVEPHRFRKSWDIFTTNCVCGKDPYDPVHTTKDAPNAD